MVFHRNFVVAVKANGKVLRERHGCQVYLPFGSEYSLLLKNLDSRRAAVKVEIDGTDVLNGRRLVLEPNSHTELERFLEDDLQQGKRFRFIQKTKEIADHRGDRLDDGLIRVEYWFEQYLGNYYYYPNYWNDWHRLWAPTYPPYIIYGGGSSNNYAANMQCSSEEGITVPGSTSRQSFHYSSIGLLETRSHVITLRLLGRQVGKPLYVRDKLICPTCGRRSKSSANFCSGCGSALQ